MVVHVFHLLVLWLVLLGAFSAIGAAVASRLGLVPRLFGSFWLGVASVVLALQWWNLFLPVGRVALGVFAVVALAAAASLVRARLLPRPTWWTALGWVFLVPLAAWVAGRSLQPCVMMDSGVYHVGAIRWAAAHAVVPGIANLHPFLGVSHGFFPLAALISALPWSLPIHHVPNGLFVFALGGLLMEAVARRQRWSPALLALLPALVLVATLPEISTASSDILELCLGGAFVCAWIEALALGWPGRGVLTACLVLALGAVLTRFSSIGALGGVLLVALAGRDRFRLVGFAVLGLAPWMAGGLLRTGVWPWPGSLVKLPVDWRVPDAVGERLISWTLAAGRMPHPWDDRSLAWVPMRVEMLLSEFQGFTLPLVGAVLVLVVSAPWWWRERLRVLALVGPVFLAVGFWGASSPLLRYAGIWVQAALPVALAAGGRVPRGVLAVALLVTGLRTWSLLDELGLQINPLNTLELPVAEGAWRRNERGTVAFVPTDQCWDAPLPCTPFLDPALVRRDPQDLGRGFRFEGDPHTLLPSSLRLFPPPTTPRRKP